VSVRIPGVVLRTGARINRRKLDRLASMAGVCIQVNGSWIYIDGHPKAYTYDSACTRLYNIARQVAEGIEVQVPTDPKSKTDTLQELAAQLGIPIAINKTWVYLGDAEKPCTYKQALARLRYRIKKMQG
jgi:hypothetical protein